MTQAPNESIQPPQKAEIGVLYGFRVLLTYMVAQYHFWQQSWLSHSGSFFGNYVSSYVLNSTGYLYVDAFILLSGFLLFLPYERAKTGFYESTDTKTFYFKRFCRIVPSYWFAVIISFICTIGTQGSYGSFGRMAWDLVSHMTFTQMFSYATYLGSPLNGALWTVTVEILFYLLFPLILRWEKKHPAITIASMIFCGLACRTIIILFSEAPQMLMNQFPAYLDVFAVGMLFAKIFVRIESTAKYHEVRSLYSIIVLVACILLIGYLQSMQSGSSAKGYLSLYHSQMMLRFPFSMLIGLAMLSCTQLPKLIQKLLDNKLMRFLSSLTMNFYFWHQFLAVMLRKAYFPDTDALHGTPSLQAGYSLLCWCVALIAAAAVTYGIEKPAAMVLKRLWNKKLLSVKAAPASEKH